MDNGINAILQRFTPAFPARDATIEAVSQATKSIAETQRVARSLDQHNQERRTMLAEKMGTIIDTMA